MKFFLFCFSLFVGFLLPLKATSYKQKPKVEKKPKSTTEAVVTRALSSPERDFQGTQSQVSETETEASSLHDDPRIADEHCCDRDKTQGFAQEPSPQENQQRIAQILSRAPSIYQKKPKKKESYGGGASGTR